MFLYNQHCKRYVTGKIQTPYHFLKLSLTYCVHIWVINPYILTVFEEKYGIFRQTLTVSVPTRVLIGSSRFLDT